MPDCGYHDELAVRVEVEQNPPNRQLGGTGRWAGSSSERLPLGPCLSGRSVEVVKHPVHNHPGHRHVEPKRERPAGNSHVLLKLFGTSKVDRY